MPVLVDGVETDGFPQNDDVVQMLYWLGDDYVRSIVSSLRSGLQEQDPGTRLASLICYEQPKFQTAFRNDQSDGVMMTATRMEATFPAQAVVVDSDGRRWRLFMSIKFHATGLDTPEASRVASNFDILRDEPA